MTLRRVLPPMLLMALACGSGDEEEAAAPSPAPAPAPQEPVKTPDVPLEGYAYLPGPGGGAEGARFSEFAVGETVYAGVDDANVRDADGNVLTTLPLGTAVTVVDQDGPPTIDIERRNVWYRVRLESGEEGRLFGGLLTPFGGRAYLSEGEDGERGWAVSFSPDGKPRLRIDKTPGSDEATTLDLTPTERFTGGRLEAEVTPWGDFDARFSAMLCRIGEGEGPACSTATAGMVAQEGGTGLVQLTPPDPWQYAEEWAEPACDGSGTVAVTMADTGTPLFSLQVPEYIRGPDGRVSCSEVGTVTDGTHRGRSVVSCVQGFHEKVGDYLALSAYYLRSGDDWVALPCASEVSEGAALQAGLVEQRIRVTVDATVKTVTGLSAPESLSINGRTLALSHVTPEYDEAAMKPAFIDPVVGQVYTNATAVFFPRPDGTAAIYGWQPDLTWKDEPPSKEGYTTQTRRCDGSTEALITFADVSAADLETVGTLADGTAVGRLKRASHPENVTLLGWYEEMRRLPDSQRPESLDAGLSDADFLAGSPWLYVSTPWPGGYVRLMRADLEMPLMCEPILYAYADPPAPIHIAPIPPLSFEQTLPHSPDGWHGIARPDGSVWVDGQVWPELFWEGRSVWFAPPEEGVVVAEDDVEDYLHAALTAQGLQGREITGFLDAWMPDLTGQGPMRIAFHPPAVIDRLAPLAITPAPDTLIRVLMDAEPADAAPTWDGEVPAFWPVPPREGLVVVEWGGVTRHPGSAQ